MQKSLLLKKVLISGVIVATIGFICATVWYLSNLHIDVLNPKGIIAQKQYDLLIFTTFLGMLIVIPVFILTISIAWRYRETNIKAKYTPNVGTNKVAETIWWGFPIILIAILSVVTWNSTHDLDPHKPLVSQVKPVTIQVVSLQWKWLFLYPEQKIATVNHIQIPVNTPINFVITADSPMNSFWIPQLAGQIYAMPGMTTKLHVNATETGTFRGSSANISGQGFSEMKFTTTASSGAEFTNWAKRIAGTSPPLTTEEYEKLAMTAKSSQVIHYSKPASDLYDTIVMKYMSAESPSQATISPPSAPTPATSKQTHTHEGNH